MTHVDILTNLGLGFKFAGMIVRDLIPKLHELVPEFPALGVLGPRYVGKTTLVQALEKSFDVASI